MKSVKTILLMALVLAAVSGFALAESSDPAVSAAVSIKEYANGTITRDAVKAELSSMYAAGTLTRADLKKVVTAAYNHDLLSREDMRWLLGQMYKEGKLTREDLRWVIVQAYNNNELTRDDVRFLIAEAYKNGELTRSDLKWLIVESYKAGELKRSDVAWLIAHAYNQGELTRDDVKWLVAEAYKNNELTRDDLRAILVASYKTGELTRADVKWLLIEMYKANELTREDIRVLLAAAYNHGELTRDDVKWLLIESYKANELTKDDVAWILREAYRRGELRKSDVKWILDQAYAAGELSSSDVSERDVFGVVVESEPAPVPSVEDIKEPNAETSAGAVSATTFDDAKAAAPADSVIKTKQAWMLYKYALLPVEKHRVGMDALIGFVESQGKNSSGLVALKDQFVSERDRLEVAAEAGNYQEGKDIVREMKDTVSAFRTDVKPLVAGNESAAKAALQAALEQNSDYFDSLVTEAREARRDRNLELFDLANARAQGRLDKASARGVNVTAVQAKLDEIAALRSDLIDAMNAGVESCKGEGIGKCNTTESAAYLALRADIESKYKELIALAKTVGQGQKLTAAVENARKIIANGETLLDTAEKRGIEVSSERAELAEINGLVDSADAKQKSGDVEGAIADLKQAQERFKSLKSDVASRRNAK